VEEWIERGVVERMERIPARVYWGKWMWGREEWW